MIVTQHRLLNICFQYAAPLADLKVVEGVVTAYATDWMRYSSHAYMVWTKHTPEVWEVALRAIPNLENSFFLIVTIDPTRSVSGWMPQWIWDWMFKYLPTGEGTAASAITLLPPPRPGQSG